MLIGGYSSYSCLYLFIEFLCLLFLYHQCVPLHNKCIQIQNVDIRKKISTSPVSNHGYHNFSSTDPRILYYHSVSGRLLDAETQVQKKKGGGTVLVILRRVRVTVVAVQKQNVLRILSMCL